MPSCPYCRRSAELTTSAKIYGNNDKDFGMFWVCWPCDAYVGCHKNSPTHAPLGRLANKELRRWKQKAHAAFDPMWRRDGMSRSEAYQFMADAMGITKEEAHIGKFDVEQCKKLVELIYPKVQEKP